MRLLAAISAVVASVAAVVAAAPATRLERVTLDAGRGPALELRVSGPVAVWAHPLKAQGEAGDRIFVDLDGAQLGPALPRQFPGAGPVLRVRTGQFSPTTVRVVLDLAAPLAFTVRQTADTVTVELRPARGTSALEPAPARPAPPDAEAAPRQTPRSETQSQAPHATTAAPQVAKPRDDPPPAWPEPPLPSAPPVAAAPAAVEPRHAAPAPPAPPVAAPSAPPVAAPVRPAARATREVRWAPQPMWTPQVSRTTPPLAPLRGTTPTSVPRLVVVPRSFTPASAPPPPVVVVARALTPASVPPPVVVATRGVTPAGTTPPPVPPGRHPISPGTPPPAEPTPVVASRHPVSEKPLTGLAALEPAPVVVARHPVTDESPTAPGATPPGPPPTVAARGATPITPRPPLVARASTPHAPGPLGPLAEPTRTAKPGYEAPPVRTAAPAEALRLPEGAPVQVARQDPPAPPPVTAAPPPPAPVFAPETPPPLIVIDAGHGGRDPGAAGVGGVLEKDVVLAAAHRLAERLSARLPVTVLLTRTDDSFVPIDERLARQGEAATLFISLHANASTDSRASGIEVFYGGGVLRPAGAPGPDPRAAKFGRYVAEALATRLGALRGEARPGEFRVLTHNPTPGTLVEIGYLTHHDDATLAQSEAYQTVLADALIDAVAEFLRGTAPVL